MTHIKQAFEQGIKAANVAEHARDEIREVIHQTDEELREASDDKITIDVDEVPDKWESWLFRVELPLLMGPKRTHKALVAYNPEFPDKKKELAEWKMAPTGYPCAVKWGNKECICEDREALEDALTDMLRDPVIGEKLKYLMSLEEAPEGDEQNPT